MILSYEQMEVVKWAAKECARQHSGEPSVAWMLRGWNYAMGISHQMPTEADVVALGALIEPVKNRCGYRQVGVRVGANVKMDWRLVQRAMGNLLDAAETLSPDDWFHEYEDIHPWRDGNGRTGSILWNWLKGTLSEPQEPPEFWGPREDIEV